MGIRSVANASSSTPVLTFYGAIATGSLNSTNVQTTITSPTLGSSSTGISLAAGVITFAAPGKYLLTFTGSAYSSGSGAYVYPQVILVSATNCTMISDLGGNAAGYAYSQQITVPFNGSGIITTTAANATTSIAINYSQANCTSSTCNILAVIQKLP